MKIQLERADFGEFDRSVASPTRVTMHVEAGLVITNATVLSWCFPLEFTYVESAFFQLVEYGFRVLDTAHCHLQAFRVHVAPFRPLALPLGKLILHRRVRRLIVIRCGFVLLRERVVIHFAAGLNSVPRTLGSSGVFWLGSVLERFFDH